MQTIGMGVSLLFPAKPAGQKDNKADEQNQSNAAAAISRAPEIESATAKQKEKDD